jgi:hypothetical protein
MMVEDKVEKKTKGLCAFPLVKDERFIMGI